MKHACTLLVAAALLLPAAASADDTAESAALAQQVVALTVVPGLDGRIDRMIAEVAATRPADTQAQARAELTAATGGIRTDLINVFSTYYARSFSVGELKDLLAFYQGPLGQKLVRVEEDKPAEVNAEIQQQLLKLISVLAAQSGQAK